MKRVSIVFEETGVTTSESSGFLVYMEGLERDLTSVPQEEMSPAEFWATAMFEQIAKAMQEAGVIRKVTTQSSEKH